MRSAIFFCFLLATTSWGASAAKNKLTMIFTDEYPPFYFKEREKGMYFEFLQAFEKNYPQLDIRRKTLSRKRIDASLIQGNVDAYSMTSTEFNPRNIHAKFIPSDVLWTTSDVLVSLRESPLPYTTNENLFDKNIGVIHGNSYKHLNQYFDDNVINRIDAYTTSELLALLKAKRIDAVIINLHGLQDHILSNGYQIKDFYVANKPLYSFNLVTLLSSDKMETYQLFNQFIQLSKENGFLAQLESKYTSELVGATQGN